MLRHRLTIVILMVILTTLSILFNAMPSVAKDDDYTVIQNGFTLNQDQPGQKIQPGSEIHQLDNGVTEVFGPDGVFKLRAFDAKSEIIHTPNGSTITANHNYIVPSGSLIVRKTKYTDVFQGETRILRVINDKKSQASSPPPGYGDYVEQGVDENVNNCTYFSADWTAPAKPSNLDGAWAYLWNGLQSKIQGTGLIQPVLEWNHSGTYEWTGAAWYYISDNDHFDPTHINVTAGDSCQGILNYDQNQDRWLVQFNDLTSGQSSTIYVNGFPTTNFIAFNALEAVFPNENINNDIYVPQDCTFHNINTSNTINWTTHYDPAAPLSGLAVVGAYQGSTQITLRTTYTPALSLSASTTTNIANDRVKLNGNLIGLGSASNVQVSFVWGSTQGGPYPNNTTPQNMSSPGAYYSILSGLSPNTTYHYKAKVVGNGTIYESNDRQFTTLPFISLGNAVDNTSLSITTGGDSNWFGQTATSYYGGSAAQSGYISDNQTTWMQTTMNGPGTVNFYWKVSSEANYDWLSFFIDGILQQGRISGNVGWQQKSFTVNESGSHILKWQYAKDGSVSNGSDCGWVDYVTITPQYTVNASVSGGNGSVSPGTQNIDPGSNASIYINPNSGYHIASITDNNVLVPISNPYVIFNVYANHSVVVTFTNSITMSVSIVLQGDGRPDPVGWQVPLTVKYFTPGANVMTDNPLYTFNSNTIKYTNTAFCLTQGVPTGNYDITAVSPTTLLNVRRSVPISESGNVNLSTLLEGNANDDNKINIQDFGILAVAYGSQGPPNQSQNWDPRADFDLNNYVNIADYGLLSANYAKYSPQEIGSGLAMPQTSLGKAVLSLKAESQHISASKNFSVDIVVDSGSQNVTGIDAFLAFDPSQLEVVSLTSSKVLSENLANSFDNKIGKINLSCGTFSPVNGSFVLGTIEFKAKGVKAKTAINFEQKLPRKTDIVYGGTSILGNLTDAQIAINP